MTQHRPACRHEFNMTELSCLHRVDVRELERGLTQRDELRVAAATHRPTHSLSVRRCLGDRSVFERLASVWREIFAGLFTMKRVVDQRKIDLFLSHF